MFKFLKLWLYKITIKSIYKTFYKNTSSLYYPGLKTFNEELFKHSWEYVIDIIKKHNMHYPNEYVVTTVLAGYMSIKFKEYVSDEIKEVWSIYYFFKLFDTFRDLQGPTDVRVITKFQKDMNNFKDEEVLMKISDDLLSENFLIQKELLEVLNNINK